MLTVASSKNHRVIFWSPLVKDDHFLALQIQFFITTWWRKACRGIPPVPFDRACQSLQMGASWSILGVIFAGTFRRRGSAGNERAEIVHVANIHVHEHAWTLFRPVASPSKFQSRHEHFSHNMNNWGFSHMNIHFSHMNIQNVHVAKNLCQLQVIL